MSLQGTATMIMWLSFAIPTILILCSNASLVLSVLMSKPGCPDRCGNVTIPYPFGIDSRCSANHYFTITCQQNSTNIPKPILDITKLEVLDISVLGTITVNLNVSLLSCYVEEKTNTLPISLEGTPFSISATYNTFVNIGCQKSVWLEDSDNNAVAGGCTATCTQNSPTSCSGGDNCCTTTIYRRLLGFQYTYKRTPRSDESLCGYAFPVKREWLQSEALQDLLNKSLNEGFAFVEDFVFVPLVLEWEADNLRRFSDSSGCNRPDFDPIRFSSTYNGSYSSTALSCGCTSGFEGNPYLQGGCTDIDECSTTEYTCGEGQSCFNTYGGYKCQDSPGQDSSLGYYHHNQSRIKLAFVIVGSVIGSLVLLFGAWWSGQAISKVVKAVQRYTFYKRNGGLLLEQQLASTDSGIEKTKVFTSKELSQATDGYNENRVLGRGGQGTVYKGMLSDGRIVAVKKSKKVDEGDLEVFINELVILSQINHRNIVKLIGCCLETEVPLLVYEYIPNGTLFHHIHEPTEDLTLTWGIRLRIAIEVAGALAYLHSASSAPIYHRDIKSINILLDDKYRAKVADFGTSRSVAINQTHLTTRVVGTFGYMDPEYFQSSQFTDKSDVYSFGVVMVELLTGEKAVTSVKAESGKSLATHFLQSLKEDQLFNILDARVLEEAKREEIVAIAELARRCLLLNSRKRPTMREVAMSLEGIQSSANEALASLQRDDHGIDEIYDDSYEFSSITTSVHMDTSHTTIAGKSTP